jgi:hypothetical protein
MAASPIARFLVELNPEGAARTQQNAPPPGAAPKQKAAVAGAAPPQAARTPKPPAPPAAKSPFPRVNQTVRTDDAGDLFPSLHHMKEKIEDAYARGQADAKARAWAEFDAMLAEQNRKFQAEMASERSAWVTAQAARLESRLISALAEIEARIAEAAVRVLRPVLMAALREQAAAELMEKLHVLVSKDAGARLVISGPEDLLSLLREKLTGQAIAAVFLPGDACDIRAEIGQTTLETCIAEWTAKLGLSGGPAGAPPPTDKEPVA